MISEAMVFGQGMEDSHTDVLYRNMLLNFKNCNVPFPANGKMLEVGSGNGKFLNYLRNQGFDIEGIDANPRDPNVLKGDARNLPYEDGSFDLVVSKQVVDSVVYDQSPQSQEKILKEIARVLKKDGFYYAVEILFETPENLERLPRQDGNAVGVIYRKL